MNLVTPIRSCMSPEETLLQSSSSQHAAYRPRALVREVSIFLKLHICFTTQ